MKRTKIQYRTPVMKVLPVYMEGSPLMASATLPDVEEEPIGWAPIIPTTVLI